MKTNANDLDERQCPSSTPSAADISVALKQLEAEPRQSVSHRFHRRLDELANQIFALNDSTNADLVERAIFDPDKLAVELAGRAETECPAFDHQKAYECLAPWFRTIRLGLLSESPPGWARALQRDVAATVLKLQHWAETQRWLQLCGVTECGHTSAWIQHLVEYPNETCRSLQVYVNACLALRGDTSLAIKLEREYDTVAAEPFVEALAKKRGLKEFLEWIGVQFSAEEVEALERKLQRQTSTVAAVRQLIQAQSLGEEPSAAAAEKFAQRAVAEALRREKVDLADK